MNYNLLVTELQTKFPEIKIDQNEDSLVINNFYLPGLNITVKKGVLLNCREITSVKPQYFITFLDLYLDSVGIQKNTEKEEIFLRPVLQIRDLGKFQFESRMFVISTLVRLKQLTEKMNSEISEKK